MSHQVRRVRQPGRTTLVKDFKWTNEDQNVVAKYIAEDGMDPEEAAEKWVNENPAKVEAWLKAP